MKDPARQWLVEQMARDARPASLWCCDENSAPLPDDSRHWPQRSKLLSNRWEIAQQAESLGFAASFNDFDFGGPEASLEQVFYRISKEKPLVNHIINQSYRQLAPGGSLYLSGLKGDGAKSCIARAAELFGDSSGPRKQGNGYSAVLSKPAEPAEPQWLDDDHYPQLRPIAAPDGVRLYSKPGIFGWQKIDPGSAFLLEALPGILDTLPRPPDSLLDLGCGYGYLSLMTGSLPIGRRVLTDNNAAAINAAQYNCDINGLGARVIPTDCADGIDETFDLILCNPPFHRGFAVAEQLTDRFIGAALRLLAPQGTALFVVNTFIPLERKAAQHASRIRQLNDNGRFKLVALQDY